MLLLALLGPAASADLAESLWRPDAERAASDATRRCAGAYVEPAAPELGDAVDAAAVPPVNLTAKTLDSRVGGVTHVAGGVVVRQGDRWLVGEALAIDERTGVARATVPVRLGRPGMHMVGRRAVVGFGDDSAQLEDAEFVLIDPQLRGAAAHVDHTGGALHLADAALTRCPSARNVWQVRASEIDVDQDAVFATARHARLVLGKVPVFYSPYLRFPVRSGRASGFLFPNVGYGEDGVDVAAPYYLNLAPNRDATLTPRYIAKRGAGIEAEFRHLDRRSRSEIRGAFLSRDARHNGDLPRTDFLATGGDPADFVPADRWLASANHRARHGRLRVLVDYAAVSDNDYFVDLGTGLAVSSRAMLERRGEIQYARGGLFTRLRAQGFQRLEPGPTPYRRLPEASLVYASTLRGPLDWTVAASWSSFRRGSSADATGFAAVEGHRIHLEPRLRLPLSRPWGFLALSTGLRHTAYDLARTPVDIDRTPTRTIRMASADGGLFFERNIRRGAWNQTLEPRLHYLYQSHAAQDELPRFDAARLAFSYRQLFRDNRFAGLDRIGDASRLAVGVTSRLLNAANGRELLAASIGAVGHLRDPRVTLYGRPDDLETQPSTALAGELRGTSGPARIAATFAWNPRTDALEEAGLAISYRRSARHLLNMGYRRRVSNDIDQTDLSFHWPLVGQWNAFGRWNHDWRSGRTVEAFAGIGYAGCCLDVKMLWHRTVDVPRNRAQPGPDGDSGLLLQLAFRGLAGFGTKVDSRLARGIKGYRLEAP